ncbi:MAG: DUF5107 domain-containing protein [Planctomycetes bacterium]|nr:DUF5107 domain-containing protein [Planctomycetota bacterium]
MFRKEHSSIVIITAILVSAITCGGFAADEPYAKIYEKDIVLPTYKLNPPDLNPMFYNGRAYQGAQGRIYPYPFSDSITTKKGEKTYKAIYLETNNIRICILPEIGGRVFEAIDKTNDYNYFYSQHVVKPALIGMLGAWMSGGIEWNFPHHHRANVFMEMDYKMVENPDGSKTLWMAEQELRDQMEWALGITVYPGKSYYELTTRFFNRTALPHSFLFWANVSVHTDENYQVIFPPSVKFATYHAKNQFIHWPIANDVYCGIDYRGGVDVSMMKNSPEQISMFAYDVQEDFLTGYNHSVGAGVTHIANHHLAPGMKFWTWGVGPQSEAWERILTDSDGQYIELMAGTFSDNQPDYSWLKPYETKDINQYWYPIRGIGGAKNANKEATVNLELTDDNTVKFGFYTTSAVRKAKVVLRADGEILFAKKIDIDPANPFYKEIRVDSSIKETELEAELFTSDNEKIISYKPIDRSGWDKLPLPETVKAPLTPEEIETIEELYLTGLRILQFHNSALKPMPYFKEALRRDAGDSRVNTIVGLMEYNNAEYDLAAEHLNIAIKRISKDYTRVIDCKAYYYLGLVLRAQGKYEQAYKNFYRAVWDYTYTACGYYQLAELSCIKGDFTTALDLLDKSLELNVKNIKAIALKASLLRKLGQFNKAKCVAEELLDLHPLNYRAMNEIALCQFAIGRKGLAVETTENLAKTMRDVVQSYLTLAVDYGNCGMYDDAIDVLSRAAKRNKKGISNFPLVFYYIGYYNQARGDLDRANLNYHMAAKMPSDYGFPFRLETIDVLKAAMKNNPADSKAPYYLGNLLYEKQPEVAIKYWEKSRQLEGEFPLIHRNLGLAYYRTEKDAPKAIASYEKAIRYNKQDARVFYEIDKLYEQVGKNPKERLEILKANHAVVVKRDETLSQEIILLTQLGRYDRAKELLMNNHFHTWEGGGYIHDAHVNNSLLMGRRAWRQGDFAEALEHFKQADVYPVNQEVGRRIPDERGPQANYNIATAYDIMGEKDEAIKHYKKAAELVITEPWSMSRGFQGLAWRRLDDEAKAKEIFEQLIITGQEKIEKKIAQDFFAKFGEQETDEARMAEGHFFKGLGYEGLGQIEMAKVEFKDAVKLDVNHLWATIMLEDLEEK